MVKSSIQARFIHLVIIKIFILNSYNKSLLTYRMKRAFRGVIIRGCEKAAGTFEKLYLTKVQRSIHHVHHLFFIDLRQPAITP